MTEAEFRESFSRFERKITDIFGDRVAVWDFQGHLFVGSPHKDYGRHVSVDVYRKHFVGQLMETKHDIRKAYAEIFGEPARVTRSFDDDKYDHPHVVWKFSIIHRKDLIEEKDNGC